MVFVAIPNRLLCLHASYINTILNIGVGSCSKLKGLYIAIEVTRTHLAIWCRKNYISMVWQ